MTTSTAGRLTQTPEIEPLTIKSEDQARNVVDLIHRSVERYMRDAKGAQIYEGTNQIHRLIVADEVFKRATGGG